MRDQIRVDALYASLNYTPSSHQPLGNGLKTGKKHDVYYKLICGVDFSTDALLPLPPLDSPPPTLCTCRAVVEGLGGSGCHNLEGGGARCENAVDAVSPRFIAFILLYWYQSTCLLVQKCLTHTDLAILVVG